jgi:iron(III) transport system ATP-binding protein
VEPHAAGSTRASVRQEAGTVAAAPALLAVHDLHCELGGREVLRGISLALQPGELGCLLGPSGCGKTTLLRAIAGFQAPRSGSIVLRGDEVSSPRASLAPEHRGVGFVFQDLALFPHLSVADNVAFGLHALRGVRRDERLGDTLGLLGRTAAARGAGALARAASRSAAAG